MSLPSLADLVGVSQIRVPREPELPPVPAGQRPAFLLDAATGLEDRLLRGWLRRAGAPAGHPIIALSPSRIRRPGMRTDPRLRELLTERWWLVPLRVVWMPAERHGRRTVSWTDLLKLGDPRDPRWFRDYLILARSPDRVRILVGEGAVGADLGDRDDEDVSATVTRRAWLALDRAERSVRGNRYTVPRFVAEDILRRPTFRAKVVELGRARHLSPERALVRARYYLKEIAATHSPFLIDLIANLIHWVIRQGYGAIHYDGAAMDDIARLGRDRPLVFLPSHKSNLDRLSIQFLLWENDLPPNHTAGGINMNFFPVGSLVRRTGVFFIRRTFKGNEVYKHVLRSYLDYLIEKRFPLEWYMEGGRSRTGKLRPPRYGLLSWVVDSHARGTAEDIALLPISIAYDHIQEVGAYAAEAAGGAKEKESFSWALRFARNLRRRYGDIHVRFAEPLSVAEEMKGADLADDNPIEVQKLAFEVMYRISMVTPVTPTALVSTVLLAAKGKALDLAAVTEWARRLAAYVADRHLPVTVPGLPSDERSVAATLAWMAEHRLLSTQSAADRTVYWMTGEQKLRASYYANTVVHYFVSRGLGEIALHARDLAGFWDETFALRDLLKFEFFFAGREEFRRSVSEELSAEVPHWEDEMEAGRGADISLRPSTVDFAVMPLLEAYQVVADELAEGAEVSSENEFLARCLARGRLYRLEGTTTSDESVSQAVYGGALLLARNRRLVDQRPGVEEDRRRFAGDIRRYRQLAPPSEANQGTTGSSSGRIRG